MKKLLFIPLAIIFLSCVEQYTDVKKDNSAETKELSSGDAFNFQTIESQNISVQLNAPDGSPMSGVMVSFLTKSPLEGGETFLKIITDENGFGSSNYNLPTSMESAVVQIKAIGFPQLLELSRTELLDDILVKGFEHSYSEVAAEMTPGMSVEDGVYVEGYSNGRVANAFEILTLGTYNTNGVPDYLESRDVISASLLSYINASLPEGKPVPVYHPKFLENAQTNLDIVEQADVWMTFVHEGAGYRNILGFYTYPTSNPPASVNEIDAITIAFPNASFSGSGGGLHSGDKVKLGRFDAGTSIGFVLLANGWNGSINLGHRQVYSHNEFNPESTAELRQHSVLLWDEENEIFLVGFEDLNREEGSDDDFNDAVFYLTSNPVEAISTENVSPIDTPVDKDGDGVNDTYDEFPDDKRYAYSYSYPGEHSYGTFAFEDQWPGFGDYDFNDLVIDYNYQQFANGTNKMVELRPEFIVKAVGAGFNNGFGVELDIDPSAIASVDGSQVGTGLFSLNANGTEAGQPKAVIIASDDMHRNFGTQGFVNTIPSMTYYTPDTINLVVAFATPQELTATGSAPFNPFLVIDQTRGREVHLPGYSPTDLVDAKYFGQGDDDSQPDLDIYYRSQSGLPWGMNLPVSFAYPREKVSIEKSYNHFGQWAKSLGFSYMDWYQDKLGYRNPDVIYSKP